jgi:hypothetical protein
MGNKMKFTESDYTKLKIIEEIVEHWAETCYEFDEERKIGYMEGILDSLYSIIKLDIDEDKKILNE